MINNDSESQLGIMPNARRILLWCEKTCPDSVVQSTKQLFPKSKILAVVKKEDRRHSPQIEHCHEYCRKNLISISAQIGLIARLRKIRWDVFLCRKHDISVKLLLGIILLRPQKLLLWKSTDNEVILSGLLYRHLFLKPFQKKHLFLSFVAGLLPLGLLFLQLLLAPLKKASWASKKELLSIVKNNILRGPVADSPWLFGWLQVVMVQDFLFGRKNRNNMPLRILVIRIDHIGDAVNTVPMVRYLRKTYPGAKITILCDSGAFLWKNCPYIDEVLLYETNNSLFNRGRRHAACIFRPFTFSSELRRRKFDLVIDAVGRTETHILSYLCRGARRISSTYYPYELFDCDLKIRHYETCLHESARALALVKPAEKISRSDCQLEFWFDMAAQEKEKSILATNNIDGDRDLLGIHPGAMSQLRTWPIERFADVGAELAKKYNMKIVFFEPLGNPDATNIFLSRLPVYDNNVIIIKNVDLVSLTALISRCRFFLCCDSGPMHLAAATQTPMVAIFGPGEYWRWQPLHRRSAIVRKPMSCSPCSQNLCGEPQCILSVQVQDVLQAAERILAECSDEESTVTGA
jgi:ADP-heptose:LPS heptosyltransferase